MVTLVHKKHSIAKVFNGCTDLLDIAVSLYADNTLHVSMSMLSNCNSYSMVLLPFCIVLYKYTCQFPIPINLVYVDELTKWEVDKVGS